jgi:hypothetical protein
MERQNVPIGKPVDMFPRGELRLPQIQRPYVRRATRMRDLLDSLYRGCRPFLKMRREALAHRWNAFIREKSGT